MSRVILYQFARPPNPQHGPNVSPFCLKLETYLRMADIAYETQVAQPSEGPKRKLPFIRIDDQFMGDSGFCVEYLEKRFDVRLDDGLSEEELGIAHSVRRMVEEYTYWTLAHYRFVEALSTTNRILFRNPGIFMRGLMRLFAGRVQKLLYAQGIGRHSREEIHKLATDDLKALSAILGNKSFILGEKPTSVDAAVFGLLAQVMWLMPDSPYEALLKNRLKNLEEYCWRMRRKYWHDWESLTTTSSGPQS